MELRDGFIVGIFTYCDSWCEACPFTSHCGLFADRLRYEAELDPALRQVVEAPPLPEEVPPPPPPWLQERIEEANRIAREIDANPDSAPLREPMAPSHVPIDARARGYSRRAAGWLASRDVHRASDPADPLAVIGWFACYIPAKVHRALIGLANGWDIPEYPPDYDGSAKAALVGIDRSHAAWLALVDRGLTTMTEVVPCISDLVWLGEALERVFPNARAFIRPAFDEPDEVAKLLASDGM
jgi:hypothetical protein